MSFSCLLYFNKIVVELSILGEIQIETLKNYMLPAEYTLIWDCFVEEIYVL